MMTRLPPFFVSAGCLLNRACSSVRLKQHKAVCVYQTHFVFCELPPPCFQQFKMAGGSSAEERLGYFLGLKR